MKISLTISIILTFLLTSCYYDTSKGKFDYYSKTEILEYKNNIKKVSYLEKKYSKEKLNIEDTIFCVNRNCFSKLSGIKPNPILIFRFRNMNCMVCVDSVFTSINKTNIDQNNVGILCNITSNPKGIKLFREKYSFTGLIFSTNKYIIKEVDDSGYPYLFVLKNNGEICDLYIPDKMGNEKTISYLNNIKKKYFERQNGHQEVL